jgi:phenylalanine-4-hydroxylase
MTVRNFSSNATYAPEDHTTWATLFGRQKALVSKYACREFLEGSKKLALDPVRVPDMRRVSGRISKMTGWNIMNAKNRNLSMEDWFPPMEKRLFSASDYIRKPKGIDFTSMPDLFHDYFGHLPFFTDKEFAETAYRFGLVSKHAKRRQVVHISRIWAHSIEFGLIKERGKIKLFGAGLLSSRGESGHVMRVIEKRKKGDIVPFNLPEVIATIGNPRKYHKKYFLLNSVKQIRDVLDAYARKESLL